MTTISPELLKELREKANSSQNSEFWKPVPLHPDTLLSLLDLIERQREALEPFANAAEDRSPGEDATSLHASFAAQRITFGGLRRARASYRGK